MITRVLLAFFMFLGGGFLGAQNVNVSKNTKDKNLKNSAKIILSKTSSDDENSRSMGMVLVFELKGDLIQRSLDQVSGDPMNWIADTFSYKLLQYKELDELNLGNKGSDRSNTRILIENNCKFIRIKLPETHLKSTTKNESRFHYGYVFNEHRKNPIEPLNTVFVMEDFYTTNRSTRIWIDYNNNFDLTDDSVFQWKYPAQSLVIPFPESHSYSQIRIAKFPYYKFRQFSSMQDTAMQWMSNGRHFVGSRECLKAVRENIIYGDYYTGIDTVKIGLQDVNLNGFVNDYGIDRIVISNQKSEEFSASLSQVLGKENYVVWMGKMYRVEPSFVAGENSTIQLTPSYSKKHANSLILDQKFPRFRFESIEKPKSKKNKSKSNKVVSDSKGNKSTSKKPQKNSCRSVRKIKAESKLVYVWSAENESFIRDSAELHHFIRLHPDIQLIMLNFGGSSKYLSSYNNRYQIESIQGILTSKNVKKMKLQSMPQYFLLDKKNRIKFIGHSIYQLNGLNLN
jgi:hypothetical protein